MKQLNLFHWRSSVLWKDYPRCNPRCNQYPSDFLLYLLDLWPLDRIPASIFYLGTFHNKYLFVRSLFQVQCHCVTVTKSGQVALQSICGAVSRVSKFKTMTQRPIQKVQNSKTKLLKAEYNICQTKIRFFYDFVINSKN